MADREEPRVSVHGIPKSQYDASGAGGAPAPPLAADGTPGTPQPGTAKHKIWFYLAIGLGVVFVGYVVYKYISNSSGASTSLYGPSPSGTSGTTSPDQLWGSQLDADYQQLISSMNANTGILQQILTGVQGGAPGSSGTGTGPGTGGGTSNNPLLPFNSLPQSFFQSFGQDLWANGTEYETGVGGNGVLWGVPITGGKNLSQGDWNKVPIGTGGKVMLQAPKSYYH